MQKVDFKMLHAQNIIYLKIAVQLEWMEHQWNQFNTLCPFSKDVSGLKSFNLVLPWIESLQSLGESKIPVDLVKVKE